MKSADKMAAQGDVLFVRVDQVPEGYTKTNDRIVAHSETGHNHVAKGKLDVYKGDDDMLAYMVVRGNAHIEHHRDYDTHETLELLGEEKGEVIWEIRRQRESSPDGWRKVMD